MGDNLNHNWINGKKVQTDNVLKVTNPATNEVIGEVPSVTEALINDAIDASYQAFSSWSKLTAAERAEYLHVWADNLLHKKEKLASIMTEEQGKPYSESLGEIEGCAQFIKWNAEEGKRIYGEIIPPSSPNQRISVIKQPVGVCALITPWNFPGAMVARKVSPALAAGCTV
ncbi:aldehyde dehydrogenase family protein, partial [Staphylococcus epidermidis]